MITQDEYNVSKQNNRELYIKINLLNYNFQTVDELSGTVVGTPNFSINADSDIRRTCSLSLIPTDASFDVKYGNKIWMDKYIQIFVGIKSNKTKKIVNTNMGLYIVHNPNTMYSAINNTISIQGLDLMVKLNGLRGGSLGDAPYVIPEGSDVREAIIALLNLAGFTKYVIEDYPIRTPYEIKIDVGGNIYDMLVQLRDILPNYQMYFDINGIFHFEQIPNGTNEQIFIDDDIWTKNLITYNRNDKFTEVKNVVRVYGKTHEITNFGKVIEKTEDTYKIQVDSVSRLRNYLKIGFVVDFPLSNPKLKVNEFTAFPILNEDKTPVSLDYGEQYYVVKFIEDETSTTENIKGYFEFMGNLQPYAVAKEENPESPFYIKGNLGEIEITLKGGEYNNIYTNSLAQERANWELYTRCKLKDSISLNCLPIYWIDVNKIISITLPNKTGLEETNLYIIKNVSTTFGINGTQSIECMRYYPFYSNYARNI